MYTSNNTNREINNNALLQTIVVEHNGHTISIHVYDITSIIHF